MIIPDSETAQPAGEGKAPEQPQIEIRHRWSNEIIKIVAGETLARANLAGANLDGANLDGANLARANLARANLYGANLARANLYGANLAGANLDGANLDGAKLNWQSHGLVAELLKRAAGQDVRHRMVAGLIAVSLDWCWDKFLALRHDYPAELEWALGVLAAHVIEGDNAPAVIAKLAAAKKGEAAP